MQRNSVWKERLLIMLRIVGQLVTDFFVSVTSKSQSLPEIFIPAILLKKGRMPN